MPAPTTGCPSSALRHGNGRLILLMIDVIQLQIQTAGAFSIPCERGNLGIHRLGAENLDRSRKGEKIMWTYKCDRCGAALDPGERCDCQDARSSTTASRSSPRRTSTTPEAKIGDYVEQAVVDDAMDCLPPASMSAGALRWANRTPTGRTPETGRLRPTYYTFKRVAGEWPNGIWQFCGCCFQGETVPAARTRSTAKRGGETMKRSCGGVLCAGVRPSRPCLRRNGA